MTLSDYKIKKGDLLEVSLSIKGGMIQNAVNDHQDNQVICKLEFNEIDGGGRRAGVLLKTKGIA